MTAEFAEGCPKYFLFAGSDQIFSLSRRERARVRAVLVRC
jgi:hypothetical protein